MAWSANFVRASRRRAACVAGPSIHPIQVRHRNEPQRRVAEDESYEIRLPVDPGLDENLFEISLGGEQGYARLPGVVAEPLAVEKSAKAGLRTREPISERNMAFIDVRALHGSAEKQNGNRLLAAE